MRAIIALALALAATDPADAQSDNFFLGAWTVASAIAGPWVVGGQGLDEKEMRGFVGKTIVFKEGRIDSPGLLACPELKYVLVDSPPEGLFQGAFDEMRRKNPSADPKKLAAALGFTAPLIRTLQTGCANELDYHFVDETTAEFALDNYIYTIKRKLR